MMPSSLLDLSPNESDEWGPIGQATLFEGIPFQSFARTERLNKAADFVSNRQERYNRFQPVRQSVFAFEQGNEKDFNLVDTTKVQPHRGRRPKFQRPDRRLNQPTPLQQQPQTKNKNLVRDRQRQERQLRNKWNQAAKRRGERYQRRDLGPSIDVDPNWTLVREFDFSKLSKPILEVEPPQDVYLAGAVHCYDPSYDSLRPRTAKPLRIPKGSKRFVTPTTSKDPIMQEHMTRGTANVFITDDLLAVIMVASRSIYSWDIRILKENGMVVFDRADMSRLEYLSVHENGPNPHFSKDNSHVNFQQNLNRESTFVNQLFQEQCWQEETASMGNPDPFNLSRHSIGYRYRLWDLDDGVQIMVRCSHDGLVKTKTSKHFTSLCTINEWFPDLNQETGWRHLLETQRGAIWAASLKDNACKVARWVVQAILAGNREMKFGMISRKHPLKASPHEILTVESISTAKLAKQTTVQMTNGWGIVRSIIDLVNRQDDGEYVLFKDPAKEVLKLFAVPEAHGDNGQDVKNDEEDQFGDANMLDEEDFI